MGRAFAVAGGAASSTAEDATLLVLDGDDVAKGPVATVRLPGQRFPPGSALQWVPAALLGVSPAVQHALRKGGWTPAVVAGGGSGAA